jgi:hypothetical protein
VNNVQQQVREAVDELVESGAEGACRAPSTGMVIWWSTPSRTPPPSWSGFASSRSTS